MHKKQTSQREPTESGPQRWKIFSEAASDNHTCPFGWFNQQLWSTLSQTQTSVSMNCTAMFISTRVPQKCFKEENVSRVKVRWNVNDQCDKVIFTDESQVFLGANQRIFIRRLRDEAMSPKYVCPLAKRKPKVSWSWGGGVTVEGTINRPVSTMAITYGQ